MTADKHRIRDLDVNIRRQLEDSLAAQERTPLAEICRQVEDHTLIVLQLSVLAEIALVAAERDVAFTSTPPNHFLYDEEFYELRITEHATQNTILQITIKRTNPSRADFVRKSRKMRMYSLGRYTELRLATENTFLAHQASIIDVAGVVLETTYLWLGEYVRIALDSFRNGAAEDLYSHLRQILSPKISSKIWLYAIFDRRGIYIPDAIGRNAAIESAAKRKTISDASPLEVVAEFSETILDFEKLFSRVAISQDISLESDFIGAAYVDSGFQLAEEAVYEADRLVTQPLVREGSTLLVAGYPVELRSRVEPVLKKARASLKSILDDRATTLRDMIAEINRGGALPGRKAKIFEFTGAFLRGLSGLSDL